MPAQIISLADFVVTKLQTAFNTAAVATVVERVYDIEFDLGTFDGLMVKVFPDGYKGDEDATRSENYFDSIIDVVYTRRYPSAGNPTKAWLDTEVERVQNLVFLTLNGLNNPLILGHTWNTTCETTSLYSHKFLRQHKVFWSVVSCGFRRVLP